MPLFLISNRTRICLQQVTTLVQKGLSRSGQSPHQDNNVNDRHHSMVELAEAKARIRKWRQEVEEKCEQVAELREELDAVQIQLSKAKQENMDLVQVGWLLFLLVYYYFLKYVLVIDYFRSIAYLWF